MPKNYTRMNHLFCVGLLLAFGIAPFAYAYECPIEGLWQSDEEKTLDNMRHSKMTKEALEAYRNDFFGHARMKMTCEGFEYVINGDLVQVTYENIEIFSNKVSIMYYDPVLKDAVSAVLRKVGGCLTVDIPETDFNEVYCKVSSDSL